jgi:hypothetical protein
MSARRFLPIALCSVLLAACAKGGPGEFEAAFPAQAELQLDSMPVTLVDQTGLVTAFAVRPAEPSESPRVERDRLDTHALRVSWIGEGCDHRLTLVLTAVDADFDLAIHVDPNASGGLACPEITVPRVVAITFGESMDPGSLTVRQLFP